MGGRARPRRRVRRYDVVCTSGKSILGRICHIWMYSSSGLVESVVYRNPIGAVVSEMAKPANKVSFDPRLLTGIPVVMAGGASASFGGAGHALRLWQTRRGRGSQR